MIEVRPRDESPEEFEKAMNKFKKYCNADGFLKEIRDRRYFETPSTKNHHKAQEIAREQKRAKKKKNRKY